MKEAVIVKTEQTNNEQINKDNVDNKIEVHPTTAEVVLKHILYIANISVLLPELLKKKNEKHKPGRIFQRNLNLDRKNLQVF